MWVKAEQVDLFCVFKVFFFQGFKVKKVVILMSGYVRNLLFSYFKGTVHSKIK